jgi:hypothetical protein
MFTVMVICKETGAWRRFNQFVTLAAARLCAEHCVRSWGYAGSKVE